MTDSSWNDESLRALLGEDKAEMDDDGLIVLSEYRYEKKHGRIGTGFSSLDYLLGGLGESALTIITGKRGEGKSTFTGQLALNAVNDGHVCCFYSGELSAHMFQSWIYSQASGEENMEKMQDQFGNDIWTVDPFIQSRIESWLGRKFLLYDNSKIKKSERNTIIERFQLAHDKYNADFFVVDNLMTARYGIDSDRDFYRAQSNFATQLVEFCHKNRSHVLLVAHPRKGYGGREDTDINDEVSGSGDITNLASNVIQVKKASDKDRAETNADSFITISKNRDYGRTGKIRFKFNPASRRLVDMDNSCISNYGWVDLC